MPRPKGLPKTGGRKKGVGNRVKAQSLLEQIREHLGDPDYHPVIQMAEFATDLSWEPNLRMAAAKEVSRYTIAVPKQVDVRLEGGVDLMVVTGIPHESETDT